MNENNETCDCGHKMSAHVEGMCTETSFSDDLHGCPCGAEIDTSKKLKIHAQHGSHDEAFIYGNVAGLRDLIATIEDAIADGEQSVSGEMFPPDGEGYNVVVKLCEEKDIPELPLQYTSPVENVALYNEVVNMMGLDDLQDKKERLDEFEKLLLINGITPKKKQDIEHSQ